MLLAYEGSSKEDKKDCVEIVSLQRYVDALEVRILFTQCCLQLFDHDLDNYSLARRQRRIAGGKKNRIMHRLPL